MKKHDEDDLPPDFKKKLTEWEIRKALVGKGQQDVEKLQKNLGEEFNKKMEEWEKIKATGHGKVEVPELSPTQEIQTPISASSTTIPPLARENTVNESGPAKLKEIGPKLTQLPGVTTVVEAVHGQLDRKGSATKIKKAKTSKIEKPPVVCNISK